MKPFSKFAIRVFLVCGLLASLVVLTLWLAHRQPLTVVAQWKQPDTITYDGLGPYYLSVFKSDIDWRGFPLNLERRYSIYVGRDTGKPSYGHEIDFTFYPMQSDQADVIIAIKNANAEWRSDGVTFITTSGHRLFIPKSMFIGGR
jgi:hypothetical protein